MRLPKEVEAAWKWGGPTFGVAGLIFSGVAKAVDSQTRRLKLLHTIHSGQDVRQVADTDEVVVATGNVWSDRPLTDTMSGEKAVASMVRTIQVHEVEYYNQRGDPSIFPDSKQRVANITRRVAPMCLRLSGEDLHLVSDSKLLANVMSHTVTRKGAQRSLRQALVDVALKDCYVTRVEEQEFLLHMDKEITAIGKVKGKGDRFEMIPDSLSRKNLREQLRECGVWGSTFKSAAKFCGWATVLLVGTYAAYKLWEARAKRRREKAYLRQAAESRRARQGRAGAGGGEEGLGVAAGGEAQAWKCIVCWNEGVDQAVFPACGHIAVCADCCEHLTQCPICRVRSTPRRVYFS